MDSVNQQLTKREIEQRHRRCLSSESGSDYI